MAMAERRNVEFAVEGGVTLRDWLFVPGAKGPAPAITMAHGYAGVKELGLERFARAFAEAGFVVLLHDHRNFGASDGAERGDVDPWQQIADWRRAIWLLESRPDRRPPENPLTAHSGTIPHRTVSRLAVRVPEWLWRRRLLPPKELVLFLARRQAS